jgi:hypothetical protein
MGSSKFIFCDERPVRRKPVMSRNENNLRFFIFLVLFFLEVNYSEDPV